MEPSPSEQPTTPTPSGESPRRGRHRHVRPPRSRAARWRRRVLFSVAGVLSFVILLAAGAFAYVEYRLHQIHRVKVVGLVPVKAAPGHSVRQTPYNVLLVGDNCRDCLDGKQSGAFGSAADVGGGRSDVTMLLHVNPVTNSVSILSIPRDLWLPIPDSTGEIRVDAALDNGPNQLVTTIEDDLDIPINHYIELNFDTFQDVVNALGGLNMYFPVRAYDAYSGLNVPTGCYHLNGYQALQVARARHYYYVQGGSWQYDGLGDISRIQRDHEFLKVLATALSSRGLSDPITDNSLLSAVAKDLTLDSTFSTGDMIHAAETFSRVNLGAAPETTLSVDEDNSPNGFVFDGSQYGDVVFPSNTSDRASITAFLGAAVDGAHLSTGAVPPVTVLNGSGVAGQETTTATALRALGFTVAGVRTTTVQSTPAETVVYYGPGHEADAQRLADDLGGAVALGQDAALAGHGLALVTGSNLTVAAPAPKRGTASKAPAPTAPSATPIGGLTQTNPSYPSFDPTACAPGAHAGPLPTLAIPSSSVLPQT